MARTRQIKPGFFLNTELAELDPLCRLIFIGLWTIADRRGRLEFNPKKIKAQILPYEHLTGTELVPYLHRLCTAGFLIAYKDDKNSYLQVVNFEKHQHIHKDEKDSEIPPVDRCQVIDIQQPQEIHRTCTEEAPHNNGATTKEEPNEHALTTLLPYHLKSELLPSELPKPASPENFGQISKERLEQCRLESVRLGFEVVAEKWPKEAFKNETNLKIHLSSMWREYEPYNPTPEMFAWIIKHRVLPNKKSTVHALNWIRVLGDEIGQHVSDARKVDFEELAGA